MAADPQKPALPILAVNYVVVFVLFGAMHFVAPAVTLPVVVTENSALFDWLLVTSIIASTWSIWLAMVQQRCVGKLGLWRLLRANLGVASIYGVITAGLFIAAAAKLDIVIPPESNLIDNRGVSQIVNFCRIPIISHPLALYMMVTALTYKVVCHPTDFRRGIYAGGIVLFVYYFFMYALGAIFSELLKDLLVSPGETHLTMMFIYWLPTVIFAVAAYVIYYMAFSDK